MEWNPTGILSAIMTMAYSREITHKMQEMMNYLFMPEMERLW